MDERGRDALALAVADVGADEIATRLGFDSPEDVRVAVLVELDRVMPEDRAAWRQREQDRLRSLRELLVHLLARPTGQLPDGTMRQLMTRLDRMRRRLDGASSRAWPTDMSGAPDGPQAPWTVEYATAVADALLECGLMYPHERAEIIEQAKQLELHPPVVEPLDGHGFRAAHYPLVAMLREGRRQQLREFASTGDMRCLRCYLDLTTELLEVIA